MVSALDLEIGDLVLVEAGDLIPGDGEVVEGIASVNEAAITGESAPVIRESGGDRSAVTGGTTVISDWLVVKITAASGSSFLDRMIALVEGAERQKTPNEIALNVLLAGMTIVFLIAVVTLAGFGRYSGADVPVPVLVALLVTLIPTTIGGLLSAIGIAGMDRLIRFNVLAMSGRAVEAAGDVDTLLLDKTGTITFGNRMAAEIIPVSGVTEREAAEAALLASLADETAEGRSIVALAQEKYGCKLRSNPRRMPASSSSPRRPGSPASISASRSLRKGAVDAVLRFVRDASGRSVADQGFAAAVDRIARSGGTPLGLGRRRPSVGRHPPQGRGQARHQGALLGTAPHGYPHRHGDRRQSGDGGGDCLGGGRRRLHRRGDARRTSSTTSVGLKRKAVSSPCAATARTMLRPWPRPMSASPCSPARRPPARPATWWISIPTRRSSSRSSASASSS